MGTIYQMLLCVAVVIYCTNAVPLQHPEQSELTRRQALHPEPPEEEPSEDTIESDIKVTPEQLEGLIDNIEALKNEGLTRRKAHADLTRRWPDGVIPYEISAESQGDTAVLLEGIEYWEESSCVRFTPYDSNIHTSRIRFVKDDGCSSYVGLANPGTFQNVSIDDGCASRGTVAHELGHAIGFWHEQSRPDRDDFVTINAGNIQWDKSHNFNKYTAATAATYRVPYDVESLMHYGTHYFSRQGAGPTISAVIPANDARMGQRDHLTEYDILMANVMYDCKKLVNVAVGKTATLSRQRYSDKPASHAVDGNTNSHWNGNSCTHSYKDFEPWFKVDLGDNYVVQKVLITNRKDCCDDRIEGAEVRVGLNSDFSLNTVCGHRITASETSQTTLVFPCSNPITARYASIQLVGKTAVLNFCEMKVMAEELVNRAAGKTATLSSQRYSDNPASLAVDGNTNSNWYGGSCTHTTNEFEPWFKVDLGKEYVVRNVLVTNRKDCCDDRMLGGEVRVGLNSDFSQNTVCGNRVTSSKISLTTLEFPCSIPVTARYVSLELVGKQAVLNFCEMKVMVEAPHIINIAVGKTASLSGQMLTDHPAAYAVDGNTNSAWSGGSCTQTHYEYQPWFKVDIGQNYIVNGVIVTNRQDCCGSRIIGGEVRVGVNSDFQQNAQCGFGITLNLPAYLFICPRIARYASLQVVGRTITLNVCEMEVFVEFE